MFLEFIVLIISVNNNMSIFSFFHETYGTFFYSFNWKMFLLALCSIIIVSCCLKTETNRLLFIDKITLREFMSERDPKVIS